MDSRPELELSTPDRVAVSLELAGIGARAFAWLADALCIFFIWVVGLLVYSISGDLVREFQALTVVGQVAAVLSTFLVGWGWDVAWETLCAGRTPGKRLAGIRVVRGDGGPPGLGESLVRNVLRAVEVPLGYAPGILAVALGARRQRIGDLVAGTLVVTDGRFDLLRYGLASPEAGRRFPQLRGRARAALDAAGFDRVGDFLRRRAELDPAERARVASRLAAVLASRAGMEAPPASEAEVFLEALAAWSAEGA